MKSLLRNLISKVKDFNNNTIPRFFVWSVGASSLYYFIFNNKFRREHHSVLVGKIKHLKDSKKEKASFYTLVRNIHRLEKGLLMKPRREVFAADFITETVEVFQTLYNNSACSEGSQIKWAYDVLSEYFNVTGSHKIIDEERSRFNSIISSSSSSGIKKSIPYYRHESNKPQISFDDFYQLTKYRRSVRWFLDRKVPHDIVDKAISAANQSPSACNRQPFEYRIIDDPKLLETVVNIPMGIKGYQHNVPMLIVVVGNLDAYFDERDRHVIYVDASLANMTLMFALETLGLSSCSINWPDIEHLEKRMESVLNLEKHQRPIMCIAVGYPDPDGMVAFSEKRDLNLIRRYN